MTDSELIRLVQCQDENAFTELISRFSPRIYNIVAHNSRQKRDAEEILMDVWLAVWQNIIGLRNIDSFGAWLYRIAHTACIRYYSSKSHQHNEITISYEDLSNEIDKESEQRFQSVKLRADAREAVHQLPQKVRSIAQKYYLDLLSVKEIASEINIPIGTVKSKLSETRKLLQKEFGIMPDRGQTMTQKNEKPEFDKTVCKIIGVGGAGCSTLKQLSHINTSGIELYAIDTDRNMLNECDELIRIQIGEKVTLGQGTDGSIELGRRAAAESIDRLQVVVSDADMIFIIAGMGGGTATAVVPVIASIARSKRIMTVCVTSRPLDAEGVNRTDIANIGLDELKDNKDSAVDAIILVPNQELLYVDSPIDSISDMIVHNSQILTHSVKSISDVLTNPGEIGVDIDDIRTLFSNQGTMVMGFGKAKGENRACIAAQNALESSLIQQDTVTTDPSMLVSISSPPDFTMHELDNAMCVITEKYMDAQPIFGMVYNDELEETGEVIVTVITSGSESHSPSTPSEPSGKRNTSTQERVYLSSTDPASTATDCHNIYNIMACMDQIPEKAKTSIANIVSIENLSN